MVREILVLLLTILLLIVGFIQVTLGQNACGLDIDAGNDLSICTGESIQLNAILNGGSNPTIQWTPAIDLSNPNILNPIASPNNTTTYTITVNDVSSNLINNGDFETQSILPATTQYTLAPTPMAIVTSSPNFYAILDVPQIVQAFGCNPDIGMYTLVVHGSTGVNVNFWCQTVPVTPNRTYRLKYKVFGIPYLFVGAPIIVGKINGQQVGSITAPNSPCGMAEATFEWQSGNNTSAEICLANSRVAGLGSMCSVDDIEFYELCEVSDQLTINVSESSTQTFEESICNGESVSYGGQNFSIEGSYTIVLQNAQGCDSTIILNLQVIEIFAEIDVIGELNCYTPEIQLIGTSSSGTFGINSYDWSTFDGNIIGNTNGSSVIIDAGGNYQLIVETSNGLITCADTAEVSIPIDTLSPQFFINNPPELNCSDTAITLSVDAAQLPPLVDIQWTTVNGNILSGQNTLSPVVNKPGVYLLIVTDLINGCTHSDQVVVVGGGDLPIITLDTLGVINCNFAETIIRVTVNQSIQELNILWSTSNGNIEGSVDSLEILVSSSGTYTIRVEGQNNCISTASFQVLADTLLPSANIRLPDSLNCQQTEITLNVQFEPDSIPMELRWQTNNGNILGNPENTSIQVNRAGRYYLYYTNTNNACSGIDSIEVYSDSNIPLADAGPDLILNCEIRAITPENDNSSRDSNLIYRWELIGGTMTDSFQFQPTLHEPGIYIFQIINPDNLCSATDTLRVTENITVPEISEWSNTLITCKDNEIPLFLTLTYTENVIFRWNGPEGISVMDTLIIQTEGWYYILLRDTISRCEMIDSILIDSDRTIPEIQIEQPDTLSCTSNEVILQCTENPNYLYQWTSIDGNIIGAADIAIIRVNKSAWYYLEVINRVNGCIRTDSIFVYQSAEIPTIEIIQTEQLNCINSTINLELNFNQTGNASLISWTTINGQIMGNQSETIVTISRPGTYIVNFTDLVTGCSVEERISIIGDYEEPEISINGNLNITCKEPNLVIVAESNFPASALYFDWSANSGLIDGPTNAESVRLIKSGTIILTAVLIRNGCQNSIEFEVTNDTISPYTKIIGDTIIRCDNTPVVLKADQVNSNDLLSYFWSTVNGTIIGSTIEDSIFASGTGTYYLTISNESNGCIGIDSISIDQSSFPPFDLLINPIVCEGTFATIQFNLRNNTTESLEVRHSASLETWSDSDIIELNAGNYVFNLKSSSGCTFDTLITILQGTGLSVIYPSFIDLEEDETGVLLLEPNISPSEIKRIRFQPDNWAIQQGFNPNYFILPPPHEGVLYFTMESNAGCFAQGQLTINRKKKESATSDIYMPTAFSPSNRDGVNDIFFPLSNLEVEIQIKEMKVFNRWGAQVFESYSFKPNQPEKGWDGKFKGQNLNPDVYTWYILYLKPEGKEMILKGEVIAY